MASGRFSFGDVIAILRNNDQLASLIGCVLTFNIGTQLVGGFAIYYFSYAIGKPELFPMFALVSGIAEMLEYSFSRGCVDTCHDVLPGTLPVYSLLPAVSSCWRGASWHPRVASWSLSLARY